eukprot:CAMPEP_0202915128 /NCGR_PEP_ID=MMETSP1392-20130828/64880_1 /ASSEMBLY_ACC=CAM_ASM_000868 /TAXON_ID=225041 /ORGANISM="Chlamydomonas chlamydogama, Strain SAG 11-48b" /LENGTH=48 /DNA_ID= /DNA_START= /DNA_END= /DNA_ORIENTATION=
MQHQARRQNTTEVSEGPAHPSQVLFIQIIKMNPNILVYEKFGQAGQEV